MKAIKLEALIDDQHELHLKLPDDVKAGRAEVIVMFEDEDDVSKSRIASETTARPARKFGQFRGKIHIADDFDSPLPDEFWLGQN